MQQLSGQDAMFLYAERPNSPMHIGPVMIYDPSTAPNGFVRFKDILKVFEQRLHRSPVFTRKLLNVPLGLDHPYWIEDPDFDLEFHVRHIALPKPGDWRQLCIQVARLHARQLDRSRPLWEAYVIEGLDNIPGLPPGSFAMFMKIHHAAIDGATGNEIISALHEFEPVADLGSVRPAPIPATRADIPGEMELFTRAAGSLAKKPMELTKLLGKAVPAWRRIQKIKKEQTYTPLGKTQKTRFNGTVTAHRIFAAVTFPLQEVKAVKNSVEGATVNDVMLSIVSGAMRRYLAEKGELPEQSLVTGAPVNVRNEAEQGAGGNVVSMMVISLRTDIEDPLGNLRAVNAEAVNSKSYLNALGARTLTDWSNQIPAQIASLGFRAAAATGLTTAEPFANTIVTNVPGPREPLYFGGARLVHSLGAGPCYDGMGLFQVVGSYTDEITLSIQACREMMPDPEFYEQCVRQSWTELRDAALGGVKPAAARGAATKKKSVSRKKVATARKAATTKAKASTRKKPGASKTASPKK